MTPSKAIFDKLFEVCEKYAQTSDSLHDPTLSYPFIFIGNIQNEDENNSDLIGTSNVNLDIYGLRTDRNILDDIQLRLNNEFRRLDEANNYYVRVTDLIWNVRPDNTDAQPLLRVMVNLRIQYTKKGVLK